MGVPDEIYSPPPDLDHSRSLKPKQIMVSSANPTHSRGSPVTIWGPGSCTFTLPRKGVPRKSVLHVQALSLHSQPGVRGPPSSKQSADGGRGRSAGSDPTPFFHCRFAAGRFPAPGPCVLGSPAIQKDLGCTSRKHFCGRDPFVEVFQPLFFCTCRFSGTHIFMPNLLQTLLP